MKNAFEQRRSTQGRTSLSGRLGHRLVATAFVAILVAFSASSDAGPPPSTAQELMDRLLWIKENNNRVTGAGLQVYIVGEGYRVIDERWVYTHVGDMPPRTARRAIQAGFDNFYTGWGPNYHAEGQALGIRSYGVGPGGVLVPSNSLPGPGVAHNGVSGRSPIMRGILLSDTYACENCDPMLTRRGARKVIGPESGKLWSFQQTVNEAFVSGARGDARFTGRANWRRFGGRLLGIAGVWLTLEAFREKARAGDYVGAGGELGSLNPIAGTIKAIGEPATGTVQLGIAAFGDRAYRDSIRDAYPDSAGFWDGIWSGKSDFRRKAEALDRALAANKGVYPRPRTALDALMSDMQAEIDARDAEKQSQRDYEEFGRWLEQQKKLDAEYVNGSSNWVMPWSSNAKWGTFVNPLTRRRWF